MSDDTVTLARQQSTDLFYLRKVNVVPHYANDAAVFRAWLCAVTREHVFPTDKRMVKFASFYP